MQEKPDFISLSSQPVARGMGGAKRYPSLYTLSVPLEGESPPRSEIGFSAKNELLRG
jgi:hypothetical protein